MALKGVWVGEVDGVHLRGEFRGVLQMVPQQFAESAELSLTGVLGAELESLMGSGLVHNFQLGVILEDIENDAVRLPEEFEPWCDNSAVCSIARLFTRYSGEEDGLRSLRGFEIVDIGSVGRIKFRLDGVGFALSFSDLLLGQIDEMLEDELARR